MSKSKLDIFVAIAGRLRNAFRINGQSTDGSNDVIIDKIGLVAPAGYLPQSILENNILVENGYLAFRTLGSNIDPIRFDVPATYVACTCLIDDGTLTLSVIEETTGDLYIYTASSVSTEWTLKSKVGRADGSVETAERLAVSRSINGTSFDGSEDISTQHWGPGVTFNLTGAVTGSVSNQKGTGPVTINTTLSLTGVSPGTYSKVTVDATGRITAGSSLSSLDIPNLPASRITEGELDASRLPMRAIAGTLAEFHTGAAGSRRIKIRLPFNMDTKMLRFHIDVYSDYRAETYVVSGYLYVTDNNWYEPRVEYSSHRTREVIVGRDSDGKPYVSIEVDDYSGVRVHSLTMGYFTNDDDKRKLTWTCTDDATTPNTVPVTMVANVRADNISTYIPNLDASKLTSGVLADARIPALSASKVTTGTFALDRLPQIPVSKVSGAAVSGSRITGMCVGEDRPTFGTVAIEAGAPNVTTTFPTYSFHKHGLYASTLSAISPHEFAFYRQDGITLAHVEAYLNGSLINRGSVPAAHIANLDTSKIATGTFHPDRIPSIPTTKVTGLGGLSTKTMYVSTGLPDPAIGQDGDIWSILE